MTRKPRPHGVDDCPVCGRRVLRAYGPDGRRAVLDAAPGTGPLAVAWSADMVPTFRDVSANGQLALGEHLFAPHPDRCERFNVVRPITAARSLRHRRREPERRAAGAR